MNTRSIIPAVMPFTAMSRRVQVVTLLVLATLSFQLSILAQGTAFTYQGRLDDGASPATGVYDLTFTLFAASSGGSAVAGPVTNSPTGVTNGLFTVTLDFGANFPGADRWLEIGVRTNGPGPFTTLTARQKITAAPYAVTARNVTGVVPNAGLSGTYSSAVTFNNAGNSFSGNGAGLTGVNAATLGGLNSSQFWRTAGNSGTTPANFLGTTDNQPLELRANGQRGWLLIPGIGGFGVTVVAGSNTIEAILPSVALAATIAGGHGNLIRSGGHFSTIGGGQSNILDFSAQQVVIAGGIENRMGISANSSVIGGGWQNVIQSNTTLSVIAGGYTNSIGPFVSSSTIGGGQLNSIQARAVDSVIGGGRFNRIQPTNESATIAGGVFNEIQTGGLESTIAGGSSHTIASNVQRAFIGGGNDHHVASHLSAIVGGSGHVIETNANNSFIGGGSGNRIGAGANYATIPGGRENVASGVASFAAGNRAQALHGGSFVWADSSSSTPFASTTNNQFLIRAQGGVGIGTSSPQYPLDVAGPVGITSVGNGAEVLILNTERAWAFRQLGSGASTALELACLQINKHFVINTTGNVGIGTTTPAYTLEVNGSAHRVDNSANWTVASDRRLKRDIAGLDDGLATLERLRPVRFHYNEDYVREHPGSTDKERFGVVAQEFQEVFPDYVTAGRDGILSVDLSPVTIHNTAAIRELHEMVKEKNAENAELRRELGELKKLVNGLAQKLEGGL